MTLLLTAAVACAGFYSLRYTEFGVLGAFLLAGEFRRSLCVAIHLREFNESLAAAKTTEECWTVLKHVCRETHFSYVSLRLGKKQFEADLQPNSSNNVARLSIALSHSENATFEHDPSIADPAMMIAPMVERLQKQLLYLDSVPVWNDSSSTPSGPLKASVAAAQLRA
jgi:hypothetical protein